VVGAGGGAAWNTEDMFLRHVRVEEVLEKQEMSGLAAIQWSRRRPGGMERVHDVIMSPTCTVSVWAGRNTEEKQN